MMSRERRSVWLASDLWLRKTHWLQHLSSSLSKRGKGIILGDEYEVRHTKYAKKPSNIADDLEVGTVEFWKVASAEFWLECYVRAVWANRQLAITLQAQGINEVSSHFAQIMF